MKIILPFLILMSILSCSKNSKTESKSKTIYKEEIRKSVTKYLEVNLAKALADENTNIKIDTIEILKIDTLTDKGILILKVDAKNDILERKLKIIELEVKKVKLQASIGVYKKNKTLKKLAQEGIQELVEESIVISEELDSLKKQVSNSVDSTTLRYFAVKAKLIVTREDMTEHTEEFPLIVNKKYRIVNVKLENL